MKIGLVGCGVVGQAFKKWQDANTKNEVVINDPPKGMFDDFTGVEAIFICIPVPTMPSRIQELQEVENILRRYKYLKVPFFLRSTVLPGATDRLGNLTETDVYFMPEFLTEKQADLDFATHPVVCGTPAIYVQKVELLLVKIFPGKKTLIVENVEAEIAKYTSNCFGAVKVNFFNIIYALSRKLGADYEKVLKAAMTPGFIEPTHTKVPGPDYRFGFGGKCLPKDLTAFIGCLHNNQIICSSLRRVEEENKLIRDFDFNKSANGYIDKT